MRFSIITLNMIVLSGPSASGKTEVAKALQAKYGICKVITTTTRPMRINEKNKIDYFFVDENQFKQMIKDDLFVEYTFYNGNYYGSTKDQISNNKCIVIEAKGLQAYLALKDKLIVSFLLASYEKTRYDRMISRGDKPEDADKRIENDRAYFNNDVMHSGDYLIDSETKTVEQVADCIYRLYLEALEERNLK